MSRNNGRRRLEEAQEAPAGRPQVDILEIEEHTFPNFTAEVSEPFPGARMITLQVMDGPNRKVIKYHFPLDTPNAQELGHKLSAPGVDVVAGMPDMPPPGNN